MGRAAQNMMLAAWNDGVASCPNGQRDPAAVERLVGAPVGAILTFGYPAKPRDPESRSAGEWSAGANRKPFEEVVRRV
jgi:nitroreductase